MGSRLQRSSRKIKVAHIITLLELGGAQQNTLHTVRNLDRGIFDVSLITGRGGYLDDEAKKIKDLKITFLTNLIREIRPLRDLLAFIQLLILFLKEKPHIIHTHSSKAGILARVAAFIGGVPIIIHTFHGFGFHPYQASFVRNFFIFLEKIAGLISTKLIAVSNENIATATRYKIGSRNKYVLIRSGIKLERFKERKKVDKAEFGIDPGKKVVTMISPFKPQKSPLDFVEVAKVVTEKFEDVKFLLVGDGVLRQKIERKIEHYKIKDKFFLLGWRRDIDKILSITDVFVLTSLWEGLPRSLVEAMTMGVPPVVNSVDGVKDIIINGLNGFLIKPRDIHSMADKIVMLLNDADLRKKIGEAAKKSIDESFDIDKMVTQQEKLYLDSLKRYYP